MEKNEKLIQLYNETKDEKYIEELYKNNIGLIIHVVNRYNDMIPLSKDDLMSEGKLEFFEAIKKYDFTQETSFSTFAYVYVKNRMLRIKKKFEAQKRDPGVLSYFEDKSKIDYENIISSDKDIESELIKEESIEYLESYINQVLTEKEKAIYYDYINKVDKKIVTEKYGITNDQYRNKVTYIRRKIRNKAKKIENNK